MTIKQWTNDIQYSPQSIFNWLADLLNKFTAAFLHEGISVNLEWLLTVGFWCQTIHKTFLRRFDTIFGLKMMMKSGLENIILKFHYDEFNLHLLGFTFVYQFYARKTTLVDSTFWNPVELFLWCILFDAFLGGRIWLIHV